MIKGIDQNTNPEATSSEYIYWAKNAIISSLLDTAINERGNRIDINLTPYNLAYKIGVVTLNQYIILFYKSQSNEDCIAVINEITNTVSIRLVRTDFEFDINYPITGRAKYNSNNELIVAFVSANTTPKYVNLDTVSVSDPLNFYNLFPISYNASNITTEVIEGGTLPNGAHIITFQYISRDRARTAFTTLSNPTYVTNIDPNQPYTSTKGNNSGTSSNKAIRVTLTDLDTSYTKIAVAVISKANGVITQKLIKELAITGTTLTFIYNGSENIGDVTLDELITDDIRYIAAKHITTLNDQLFLADVKTNVPIDYQSIVNQTVIQWVSTLDFTNTMYNSSKYKAGNTKSFLHDEVYAMYMQIENLDGTLTDWFHVPGREPTAGERGPSGLGESLVTVEGRTAKVYELGDTASSLGTTISGLFISAPSGAARYYGNMGAWENNNETYDDNFPDMPPGTKVRHHKFPSIEFMAANVYNSQATYGTSTLDRLDIVVTNPAIDYSLIKGYRIGYAKRTLGDVSVLGMGLTICAASPSLVDSPPSQDTSILTSSAGNFNISCLNGSNDNIILNKNYIRFNSFDLWQDRPVLAGSYLRNYIKIKADKLSDDAAGYAGDSTYGQVHNGSGSFDMVTYVSNFTKQGNNNTLRTGVPTTNDRVKKLTNPLYLPNNVKLLQDGIVINNLGLEETMFAKVEGSVLDLSPYTLVTDTGNSASSATLAEEVYLASIKQPKSDFFIDFANQGIVVNPTFIRSGGTNMIENIGDAFVGMYSYAMLSSYNRIRAEDPETVQTERVVNFKMHSVVGRHNPNLRYLTTGDYSTYFYPDMGLFTINSSEIDKYWFYLYSRQSQWNNFQYSKDYSTVVDLETFGVYNREVPDQSNFNFRIIRSTKASRENALEDGWKTFRLADYFDTVRNKGEITNLESWGNDALIIHHRNAIFRTRDKAVLKTDLLSVTLGSGDIFELEPREERPTNEGTGGTQHKFSCRLTEFGYFFIDEEVRKAYLYDGQQLAEVGKGLRNFFLDNLSCKVDNPFLQVAAGVEQSIVTAYDQANKRLVLSQKAVKNFTVSFDFNKLEWSTAHDFTPEYMFNTRKNLFSFRSNDLYTHNVGDRGKYYGTVYPFYIDFIVNDEAKIQKLLEAIYFFCKVKNSDGSINQRKTITAITIWNDQHCTDKIELNTNETDSLFVDANVKVVDERWQFDDIKDSVDDPSNLFISSLLTDSRPVTSNLRTAVWYDTEPVRGKYFIVRLEYSNIENKEVHLRDVIPSLRASKS
jgi:hypothetical protein